ncbi:MAG: IPT/TIG domain-containing protein [Propionibacteriaceae bacterium]|nr:IPT/TIG domain-containing protein [Propionibacteriaceae bacterium]
MSVSRKLLVSIMSVCLLISGLAGLVIFGTSLVPAQAATRMEITSITPDVGPIKGGQVVTIHGQGFDGPPRYIPVPFIKFNGYEGISTGIAFTANTEVSVTYSVENGLEQIVWSTGLALPRIRLDSKAFFAMAQPLFYYRDAEVMPLDALSMGSIHTVITGRGSAFGGSKPYSYTPIIGNNGTIIIGSVTPNYHSFFTGTIYAFSINESGVVKFDGTPAYDEDTGKYGLYDSVSEQFFDNWSTVGSITGPTPNPTPYNGMSVIFSGLGPGSVMVSETCTDLTVISTTEATCAAPASMLDGEGSGIAAVTAIWTDERGKVKPMDGSLPYLYRSDSVSISSITPSQGSIWGGEVCSIKGTGFITYLDGIYVSGVLQDPGVPAAPAAWTVNGSTVYGWHALRTDSLLPASKPGAYGVIDSMVYDVDETVITFGNAVVTSVNVTSPTTLTCTTPVHNAGDVDVTVIVNTLPSPPLVNGFFFIPDLKLLVDKKGWDCPAGQRTLADIQAGRCTALPAGKTLTTGTVVTWSYETIYAELNPDGSYANLTQGKPGLTNVSVKDDDLGVICTRPSVNINAAFTCVMSAPVTKP